MKFDHQNILDYSVENDVTVSRTSTVAQKVANSYICRIRFIIVTRWKEV